MDLGFESFELRSHAANTEAPSLPVGVPVHLLVSFFRDRKDQEYFLVVIKNETRNFRVQPENLSQTITLTFREEVEAIETRAKSNG